MPFLGKVIRTLEENHLSYALIGGYAVALHGAIRGTVDVDLVIPLTRVSLKRVEIAMEAIGLRSRLPITASEVFNFREEYLKNRSLVTWSFVNADNPLEMVDILLTEDLRQFKTVNKKAFGMKIKVVSIGDLIALKEKAGRPQDLEDLKALERLQ